MKRPLIGSQVVRSTDSLQRVAVVINRTAEENVLRYAGDSTEIWDQDVPLTYVGLSDPETWDPGIEQYREANAEELAMMVESIKKNGLLIPIMIQNGMLMDGRNRMLACNLAGVEPSFVEVKVTDSFEFSKALNGARRHLGKEDHRRAIEYKKDWIDKLVCEAEERRLANLKQFKSPATEGLTEAVGGKTSVIVAEQLGTSRSTVNRIFAERKIEKQLEEAAPQLADKVKAGELSLKAARIQAGLLAQPAANDDDPTEFEVTISFPKRHLPAFKVFAKTQEIVWYDVDAQKPDENTQAMLDRRREGMVQ